MTVTKWKCCWLSLSEHQHVTLPVNARLCKSARDITSLPTGAEPAESWVPLGLFSVILTIWSFCQHTQIHTRFSVSVILPVWNVCCLLRCGRAEHTFTVHRGTELLIKSSSFISQCGLKVQSIASGLSSTVLNPHSCVFVTLEERRNSCRTFGGSQTDCPSWSGSSQIPDGAAERSHEGGRRARRSVQLLTTHAQEQIQRLSLLLFWFVGLWKGF